MRIAISEQDIALIKKSAKVLRKHLPGKIGQQKALDTVSSFFGYKDYFSLTREGQGEVGKELSFHDFQGHITPSLTSLGLSKTEAESLFSIWSKLSAFKQSSRPKILINDEFGVHMDAQRRSLNEDVIDFLSTNNLPRYEWWVAESGGRARSILEPSVFVLNKIIQQTRELEEELGHEIPRFKSEQFDDMAEQVRSMVLPTSLVSALEAVTDIKIAAKPFKFDIAPGQMAGNGGSPQEVWVICHTGTDSLLAPVFSTKEDAQTALAGILVTGSLANVDYITGLHGMGQISITKEKRYSRPVETSEIVVKVQVTDGRIVDAVLGNGEPGLVPHHRMVVRGFELIQYRDLNTARLPANTFSRWGSTKLTTGGKDTEYDYTIASLPKSAQDAFGAISEESLGRLRQLLRDFKTLARTAMDKIQAPLPTNIIEWMHSRLVRPNRAVDPEQYYEFDQQEMAKHVPQLAQQFPSDLLDEWHSSYVSDIRGYRPCGVVEGEPAEFISYLFCYALTGEEPKGSNDVKVGAVILSLALQESSGQIDIDVLNENRRGLESALEVMDTWWSELNSFQYGLEDLTPDEGMVSHGVKRTTMSDLYRVGRKFSVTPHNIASQHTS